MNTKALPKDFYRTPGQMLHGLIRYCVFGLILAMLTTPARAGFHLWSIREVYTDVGGTLQFIELFDSFGGQTFVGGQQISVVNVGGTQTHTFTIPGNISSSTLNHALLFGTAGLSAAGGPTPDYIIPNNFLFPSGGTINFFGGALGGGGGPYSALPTDGVLSRSWVGGGNAVNTPQNFAGQTGFISVPEPASLAMLGLGVGLLLNFRRQQR